MSLYEPYYGYNRLPFDYPQVSYQLFPEEYFSGCDVHIFFGDLFVDEISGLQFMVQEAVRPIYGYASRRPDAFARGVRLVQGAFRLNFREAYYLQYILDRIAGAVEANPDMAQLLNGGLPGNLTVEQFLAMAGWPGTDKFERIAQAFERSVWGERPSPQSRSRESFFVSRERHGDLFESGFTIRIAYGQLPSLQSIETFARYGTVRVIEGVQLTDCQQVIDETGRPIQEEYAFVAADAY